VIERIVEENVDITLGELKTKVELEILQFSLCIETVRRELGDLCITRKRITQTKVDVNKICNKEKRKLYAMEFLDNFEDDEKNFFIDESGFNLYVRRNYGRSKKGTVVSSFIPSSQGANISLISAINRNTVIYYKCYTGSVNGEVFLEFFDGLVRKCGYIGLGLGCTFFMDNARIHHSNLFKSYCDSENIRVKYLAPYSYMLNPIEYSFSKK
jgi:transposase